MDRQVIWQTNYLHSSLLANLDSCNTLPNRREILDEDKVYD